MKTVIDLSNPKRSERRRSFQPPWYTVFIYECLNCKREVQVRANSFRGRRAVPDHGGIYCPHCDSN